VNDQPTQKLCECGCGQPTRIAKYTAKRDGLVKGKGKRFLAGHGRTQRERIYVSDYSAEDRGYVTPCWIWAGFKGTGAGYARVMIGAKHQLAHRAMYEQEVGPIPEGLTLDHLCNVHACVNPAHLEPVTLQENIRRRDTRDHPRSS
jgi:HNH endonuclease